MIFRSVIKTRALFLLICVSSGLVGLNQAQITRTIMPESTDSGLGGGNAIEGRVYLASGQKMDRRIRVRLVTMTRGDVTSMTDDNGNFAFRGLVVGDYTVVIDGEKDLEPFSQQIQIIQFRGSPPGVYPVNARLKFKADRVPRADVVSAGFANVPPKALDLYNKAKELAKESKHAEAIEQLKLAVAEYPDFMLAFNEMGVEYLRLNELERADESFQAALKIQPDALPPLVNRGIALVALKKFDLAVDVLQKAKKVDDKSAAIRHFLGQALANLGRFDEAEKEFVDAVKLGGDEMKEAHRFLAIIYGSRQDTRRELAELETYLRLVPQTPDADQLRALVEKLKQKPAGRTGP